MRRQAQMKPDVLFAFADEPLFFEGIHQPSVTVQEPRYTGATATPRRQQWRHCTRLTQTSNDSNGACFTFGIVNREQHDVVTMGPLDSLLDL